MKRLKLGSKMREVPTDRIRTALLEVELTESEIKALVEAYKAGAGSFDPLKCAIVKIVEGLDDDDLIPPGTW